MPGTLEPERPDSEAKKESAAVQVPSRKKEWASFIAGYDARKAGKPKNAPFSLNPGKTSDWRYGWDTADKFIREDEDELHKLLAIEGVS